MSSDGIFWGRARVLESPAFPKIWRDIHTEQNPNPIWWDGIVRQIQSLFCDCGQFLETYVCTNPPRYNDWFAWSWELHEAVNAKLGYGSMSIDNARACWLGIGPQTKPKLVITVATGAKFKSILAVTRPHLRAYAERCDADYLELTNQTADQWQMEKFRVYPFAQQYEQTLFIDSDCYVRSACPNIFEMGETMLHSDLPHNTWFDEWAPKEYQRVLESQGIANKPIGGILNSGVVLCSKRTADIWRPPTRRLPDSHCSEQWWVQHQCDAFDVKLLPTECNVQYWFKDFEQRLPTSQIIHLANAGNKLELLQNMIADYP
jgi:hypothetical protein